jgi:hypothetical protein
MLEIHGSAIWTWHSGERPRTVGTSGRKNTVPPQIPLTTKSSDTPPSLPSAGALEFRGLMIA